MLKPRTDRRVRIESVEAHADKLSISVAQLFAKAGVAYSTWWRWNETGSTPQLDTVNKLLAVKK